MTTFKNTDSGIEVDGIAILDANDKGAANGVAELDASGHLPLTQLPDIPSALTVNEVADIAARDAIVDPVEADVAIVADAGAGDPSTYVWNGTVWVKSSTGAIEVSTHESTYSHAMLHPESHTIVSHSDTTATGTELETLTDGSNADTLHVHNYEVSGAVASHESTYDHADLHTESHTIVSHSDTPADFTTGASVGDMLVINAGQDALEWATPGGYTHYTGSAINLNGSTANVLDILSVNTEGHVTGASFRNITYSNVGAAASSHTHTGSTISGLSTGDITSGSFSVARGGTGTSSLANHYVLVGSGTSAITPVTPSTSGYVLTSNGTGSDPSFQAAAGGTPNVTAIVANDNDQLTFGTGNDVHLYFDPTISDIGIVDGFALDMASQNQLEVRVNSSTVFSVSAGTVWCTNDLIVADNLTCDGLILNETLAEDWGVLYKNSSDAVLGIAPGTSGKVLTSAGTGSPPVWGDGQVTAYVIYNASTGSCVIGGSRNVSSVTHTATGVHRVNFTSAQPIINYGMHMTTNPNTGSHSITNGGKRYNGSKTTNYIDVNTISKGNSDSGEQMVDLVSNCVSTFI